MCKQKQFIIVEIILPSSREGRQDRYLAFVLNFLI